jgi:hypothetical protein
VAGHREELAVEPDGAGLAWSIPYLFRLPFGTSTLAYALTSSHLQAAVDGEHRAGDVSGVFLAEIAHRPCDL